MGNSAERGTLGSVGDLQVNTQKKNLRNNGESGCGWLYLNPKSTENLRKTQKDNVLKTKRILKPKDYLSGGLVVTFIWPAEPNRPYPSRQLFHCNKHFKYLLNKNDQCLKSL